MSKQTLNVYGQTFASRLLLGTSQYPSPKILADAVRASGAGIVTVSLRREAARIKEGQAFWGLVRELGVRVLPNTTGCHSVKEAVTTAQMAREIFDTPWVKLEVIGEADIEGVEFGLEGDIGGKAAVEIAGVNAGCGPGQLRVEGGVAVRDRRVG